MKPITRLIVPVAFSLFALACSSGADEEETTPAVSVRTEVVTEHPFTETLGVLGTISARAGFVSALSAPASARVANVFVTSGQRVSRGDRLVEFEQGPFTVAFESAKAAEVAAEAAHARAQRLVNEGIAPRKDLDQAAAELAQAKANLAAARRAQELSVIRSPLNGVVTQMNAVLGSQVESNQLLVEIADPSALDLLLNVTPTDAARIRVGADLSLSAGETAGGDTIAMARVFDVAAVVDSATRSVVVRGRITSPRRTLRIGETVSASVTLRVHQRAITVPQEALVPEGDEFHVFVVDTASIAHERKVTTGARDHGLVQILTGLSAGERVVTFGAYGVQDSARVVVPGES